MATMKQKIAAEFKVRQLLKEADVPFPDDIEYGFGVIRLFWNEPKVCLEVDIDGEMEDLPREEGFEDQPSPNLPPE